MSAPNTPPSREYLKPPVTEVGVLGWLRTNLFNTWYNSLLSVSVMLVLWQIVPPFFSWAFIDSVWNTPSEACRDIEGACWSVIPQNISFIIFGFFPDGEQWRPGSAMLLLLSLVFYSKDSKHWKKSLGVYWLIGLVVMPIVAINALGGWESMIVKLAAIDPTLLNPFGAADSGLSGWVRCSVAGVREARSRCPSRPPAAPAPLSDKTSHRTPRTSSCRPQSCGTGS